MYNQILVILFAVLFPGKILASKPHIIFILADDLGWNDVGFHGSNQIPTPNIDALAYTGIILNNYYVTPICTPSRSALLTGKYPIHTGLQHGVIHGSAPYGLDLNETITPQFLKLKGYVTRAIGKWHLGMQHRVIYGCEPWGLGLNEKILPQYFKQSGYITSLVGKWHLGHFKKDYLPEERGFDSHYGYWTGRQDYYDHTAVEKRNLWGYDMRRGMKIAWSDFGQYTTDLLTNEAVKIIQNHDAAKPLFLYIAHLATHSGNGYSPLQASNETVSKFNYIENKDRRMFAGMLSKLDDSVGSVVTALQAAGMLNNSIIIFSTDNGGAAAGFDLNAASNWPLRGVKDTLWEGGVRGVGLIWSSLLPSSKVSYQMMHITDWLPTLLSILNVTVPSDLDGINMWETLAQETLSPRTEILLNIDIERNFLGLRHKNWKYLKGDIGDWDDWYGPSGRKMPYNWKALYDSETAKAIQNIKPLPHKTKIKKIRTAASLSCQKTNLTLPISGSIYLFDIEKDPCEKENLASSHPEIVSNMERIMRKYFKTMVKPRNKPIDPRSDPKFWGYVWTNWMDYIHNNSEILFE